MLRPEKLFCENCDLQGMTLQITPPEADCIAIQCLHCHYTVHIEIEHLPDTGGLHDHPTDLPSPLLPPPRGNQP